MTMNLGGVYRAIGRYGAKAIGGVEDSTPPILVILKVSRSVTAESSNNMGSQLIFLNVRIRQNGQQCHHMLAGAGCRSSTSNPTPIFLKASITAFFT